MQHIGLKFHKKKTSCTLVPEGSSRKVLLKVKTRVNELLKASEWVQITWTLFFFYFSRRLRNSSLIRPRLLRVAWLVQITFGRSFFAPSKSPSNAQNHRAMYARSGKRYSELILFHMRVQFHLEGIQVNLFRSDWVINNVGAIREVVGVYLCEHFAFYSASHVTVWDRQHVCKVTALSGRTDSWKISLKADTVRSALGNVSAWLMAASLKFR